MDRFISEPEIIKLVESYIHEIITESGVDKNKHTNEVLRRIVNDIKAIPNKTEPKQALYEIRETIDDWWDKRIITNHTVYKMLRKLVEEKMYRD